MRHGAILVSLLAAGCREEPVPPSPPEIAIAESPPQDDGDFDPRGGRLAHGKPDAPFVAFRLRDGGLLRMRVGDEWRDATLDDASRLLAAERDRTSRVLSVEAEPAVPWQHVQWLLTLAAEEYYSKVHLSDGTRDILALVPLESYVEWSPEKLPTYVVLRIDAIPRASVSADWNGTDVLRPTRIACRGSAVRHFRLRPFREVVGGLETLSLGDAVPWIARARTAAAEIPRVRIVGRIRAAHTVPFATVLDVMETCVRAGLPDVNLLDDLSIPSNAVRSMPRLPYPARGYDPPVRLPPEDD